MNRGIQLNQTMGKFSASFSWNDGFYSNRYTWLSGALAYTNGPHSLSFVAGGNAGKTGYTSFATPVQNNGSIYNIIYTYTKGSWIIQPYVQYTDIPTDARIGVVKGATDAGRSNSDQPRVPARILTPVPLGIYRQLGQRRAEDGQSVVRSREHRTVGYADAHLSDRRLLRSRRYRLRARWKLRAGRRLRLRRPEQQPTAGRG